MGTDTNFNTPPYFDDFDETKNYHRILARPAVPLQAREVTQSQTILQNQIERFADHFFKDGSVVEGVGITYHPKVHYISCADYFNSNTSLFPTDIDNTYLVTNSEDSNNAVRAIVKIAKSGSSRNAPSTNRFYFDYISTGKDSTGADVNEFAPGDTLYFYDSNQTRFGTLDSNNLFDSIETLVSNSTFNSNGYAYCISTSDGKIYQKGFFVRVEPHTITVRDFSTNTEGYVVGFETTESIIDENIDDSLYDNALGYSNENAPGAHRLKLTPTLVSRTRDTANTTPNFFPIVEFDGSSPTEQNDDPEYSRLQEKLSKRTWEESGDYVIEPFKIETLVNSANSQTFFYQISPGVGYVRGNRIEKVGITKIEAPRAIDTQYDLNKVITGNYGNYVIVDEFAGVPSINTLQELTIYDSPQRSISDAEGSSATPIGTIVGYCNVRSIVFESGTKGRAGAKYLLYITNVRMLTGKTFQDHARSFYSTSAFGNFKADIVLDNNIAVIRESEKNSLVFNSGLQATKSLTNNTGVGDTSFVYTQVKSAGTMTNTGIIQVTMDASQPGGTETLNSSIGTTLTGNLLEGYSLFFSNAAYSANEADTVAITSGSLRLVGNNFNSNNLTDSLILIYANSSQSYVRKVTEVANTTQLTINIPIPQSNAAATYRRYWAPGTPLPLANVTINSNTQFTANLGLTLFSPDQTIYAAFPVKRSVAQKKSKTIRKSRYIKIDCTSNTTGPWNLGFADIHKIRAVYFGTTYATTNPDRKDWFTLDNGQRDSHYEHGKLVLKPQFASKITTGTRMVVVLDYFVPDTSTGIGFFSVESYRIDDANTSNTTAITTLDIPNYNGLDLRNAIDFRPYKANTANDAITLGDATINPATSNSNTYSTGVGQFLIAPDTNFEADFEYYVPRIDILSLNSSGGFSVNRGTPSKTPKAPFVESDQSIIAETFVPAYPSPTVREVETAEYKSVSPIITNIKTNKRYTMRDIAGLEERIERAEFYVVLNTLEQQAKDMVILDENGLNRFKNGIFADPFNSHAIGDVTDLEYKIAIDPQETIARPKFDKHDIDFTYSSSNSVNTQQTNRVVTLPYTSNVYLQQLIATNYRVVAESSWQWTGRASLYPTYDLHREEDSLPNINVNLDLTAPWRSFAASPFGTIYGDWRTVSTGVSSSVNSTVNQNGNTIVSATTTTTTSSTVQEQTLRSLQINTLTESYRLGSFVTDVSINPYIREQVVSFIATGLKPNTRLYFFFDDVNVTQYVAPGVVNTSFSVATASVGEQNRVVTATGSFGDAVTSNSSGGVAGRFSIPPRKFRTGDRIFQITNVDDIITGADAKITTAIARFSADSVEVTKQSSTLNVTQPIVGVTSSVASRTLSSTSSSTTVNVINLGGDGGFEASSGDGGAGAGDGGGGGGDPLTQSFPVLNLPTDVSGCFVTKIGIFFKQKDPTLGCSLFLSETDGGFPNMSKILGTAYLPSANITVSETANAETIFEFSEPVYLISGQEYAFTIAPDANSPEYVAWTAKTGEYDIVTGVQASGNPFSGTMFMSANQRTWTAIQKEDVKFKVYRAKFTEDSGYAIFENEADDYLTIDGFTRANSSVALMVGDVVKSVNSSSLDVSNVNSVIAKTLLTNSSPSGVIQYFNETDGNLWLNQSAGGFSNTTNPTIAIYRPLNPSNASHYNANTLIAYGNTEIVKNLAYHAVVPKFGLLQPSRTLTKVEFKGTSNSNIRDNLFTVVSNETEYELQDYERHAMSYSNEVASLSSNKSTTFKITLQTSSDFVSPVISLNRKAAFFIQNIINNTVNNEHTRYGNAVAKYVSKTIVLKDGIDAEDLKVALTASRPYETDIKVYAKIRNAADSQPIDDKVWTLMQYDNGGDLVYTSGALNEFREYSFSVPTSTGVSYAAFANTSNANYSALPGAVEIVADSTTITGKSFAFNSNTQVASSNDAIAIASASTYFKAGDPVIYFANGQTVVTGLISNNRYFIQSANATHVKLSSTKSGAAIDIAANANSENHFIIGTLFTEQFIVGDKIKFGDANTSTFEAIRTITNIANNTTLIIDKGISETDNQIAYYRVFGSGMGSGIVEYTNSENSRFAGFKEFKLKIVLTSSNAIRVPKLNDVRGIACLL